MAIFWWIKNVIILDFTQDDHITKVNAVPRWIFTKHLNSPTPFASSSPFFLAILCRIDAFSLNFPEVYYFINKTTNLWSESICVYIWSVCFCTLPSLRGSSVWIISWKMLFLMRVLWREAELPPLWRRGLAYKEKKNTFRYLIVLSIIKNSLKSECRHWGQVLRVR